MATTTTATSDGPLADNSGWVSVKTAAGRLGVKPRWVREMARRGWLHWKRIDGRLFIHSVSVAHERRARETGGRPPLAGAAAKSHARAMGRLEDLEAVGGEGGCPKETG